MEENILSRILVEETGMEYHIGVVRTMEFVTIKLTAETDVDWSLYSVQVQDISNNIEQNVSISQDGECFFEIPIGARYSIILPAVDGYIQPTPLTYTASIAGRNIDFYYSNKKEMLNIRLNLISDFNDGIDVTELNGRVVTIIGTNGNTYSGTVENSKVSIEVPYYLSYSIQMPKLEGFTTNLDNKTFVSGVAQRNLVCTYFDYNNLGVHAYDVDGNAYTIEQLEEMGTEAASALIVAGAFSDFSLAKAKRKDGGTGCSVCWDINSQLSSKLPWASSNVDFSSNNPIVAKAIDDGMLSEDIPYNSSSYDGSGESAIIMQIGTILAEAGSLNLSNPTPVFVNASNKKLTFGGITRYGFVGSVAQISSIANNISKVNQLYAALGKTPPKLTEYIVTCRQSNATQYAIWYQGGTRNMDKGKGEGTFFLFDL